MEEPNEVAVCGKKDCSWYKEQTLTQWGYDSGDLLKTRCHVCTEFTGLNLYEAKKDA